MRIFKFGGASVKDAEGVRNLVRVLEETGTEKTFLIVSAMGKTTNAMEAVVDAYFTDKPSVSAALEAVQTTPARHHFVAGAQVQVVGVAEDDLGTDLLQLFRQHPFDRALGADRHEGRCFNPAPACVYRATACLCIMTQIVQLEFHHVCIQWLNIMIFS